MCFVSLFQMFGDNRKRPDQWNTEGHASLPQNLPLYHAGRPGATSPHRLRSDDHRRGPQTRSRHLQKPEISDGKREGRAIHTTIVRKNSETERTPVGLGENWIKMFRGILWRVPAPESLLFQFRSGWLSVIETRRYSKRNTFFSTIGYLETARMGIL